MYPKCDFGEALSFRPDDGVSAAVLHPEHNRATNSEDSPRPHGLRTHPTMQPDPVVSGPLPLSLLPALPLLAILAPGARNRVRQPRPVIAPAWIPLLHNQQRQSGARFDLAPANTAGIALEHGLEGNLLLHYASTSGNLTIACGWLGAGRRRYIWVPLRPTLSWNPIHATVLAPQEMTALAADLHAGLEYLGERHVIEEFLPPIAIPEDERQSVFKAYSDFMQSHGWQVTYDESRSKRFLKRASGDESPQHWSSADREVLVRLEALVTETLKGLRSSSRILYQAK